MTAINPISRKRGVPCPEERDTGSRGTGPGCRDSRSQRGFALLVALLAIVILTAIATGGFLLANSENRTSANHLSTVEAFYLADAGLRDFLGSNTGVPPAQRSFTYDAGSAVVTSRTLRTGLGTKQDEDLYQITSVGNFDQGGVSVTREVSSVALLQPFDFPAKAGFASGGGINKNGNSGKISGVDASDGSCGRPPEPDLPGVFVPEDGYTQNGGDSTNVLEGDPLIEESSDPLGDLDLDWEGIKDGTVLPHQYTVPPDDWPDFDELSEDEWPIIYVDNPESTYNMDSGHSGQGTLIVSGNLELGGNVEWDGPMMVGGAITDNGQGNIRGGVITGLNGDASEDDLDDSLDGTKIYEFHSCNLYNATRDAATFSDEPGTWHQSL